MGIRLLGGFEVTVGDRLVAADAWRLRKAKTLVKLLVLAGGHRMHREGEGPAPARAARRA